MGYTNSPLVVYTKLSPNHSGQRTHSIDRITPHCVVGQLSAESICGCFTSPTRQASATMALARTAVFLCAWRRRTAAGARPAIPMTREQSPSNVPAT